MHISLAVASGKGADQLWFVANVFRNTECIDPMHVQDSWFEQQ
jgi:hypothetical protein